MLPEHLDLLVVASSPSPTPDGACVVASIGRPDLESDRYTSQLWSVPVDGGAPQRITSGGSDTAPAVSPDGTAVAFLRSTDGAPPQIHLVTLGGGEPMCLTEQPLGAGAPVWSPDGTKIAWSARVPAAGRYGTEDDDGATPEPSAEPPRLVTEFRYRIDGLGYTNDRRMHVFVADVHDLRPVPGDDLPDLPVAVRQLTDGDADDTDPMWEPDGAAIAFVSSRHDGRDGDLRSAVHVVDASAEVPDADPPAVTGGDLSITGFRWLGDGRLAVAGVDLGPGGRDFIKPTQLWVTEAVAIGAAAPVAVRLLSDEAVFDLDGGSAGIVELDGRIVARDNHRGTVRLLAFDPDATSTAPGEPMLDVGVVVTGQAVGAAGSALVVTAAAGDRAGDVGVVQNGDVSWRTDVSDRLRAEGGVVAATDVVAPSAGGRHVHGWVLLPDSEVHGDGPYPLLLSIHGGPFAQNTSALFDEAQVYAGAGYALAMCKPSGSAGYGFDHGRSIVGAMGGIDADDVLAFVDHVLGDDRFPTDAARVGVMGGSYGGYMTATLTTRTDRFVAAIVERGYLDAGSFFGSSDIGWFFPGQYHGSIADGVVQTPMAHVDRVTTPTLVIHSEADWRTPVEQGQRWYAELKARGVRTELLLFPGEGHELSRSGRPRHRRARFDHILRWWSEHLPVD